MSDEASLHGITLTHPGCGQYFSTDMGKVKPELFSALQSGWLVPQQPLVAVLGICATRTLSVSLRVWSSPQRLMAVKAEQMSLMSPE